MNGLVALRDNEKIKHLFQSKRHTVQQIIKNLNYEDSPTLRENLYPYLQLVTDEEFLCGFHRAMQTAERKKELGYRLIAIDKIKDTNELIEAITLLFDRYEKQFQTGTTIDMEMHYLFKSNLHQLDSKVLKFIINFLQFLLDLNVPTQ